MTSSQNFYKILDQIKEVKDLRDLTISDLKLLAEELRSETIRIVSKTGGHLGAGLGVVELTIAIHHVFNTPSDLFVMDIGHQSYPHKILTGRRSMMHTLRQGNGISGFTRRAESEYDCFGAGHCSTSISAALGMAAACRINSKEKEVIALIGDGALSAGMAYEALNNAASIGKRVIVILNDNKMSISPAVGAMTGYLSRLISSKPALKLREMAKNIVNKLPNPLENIFRKADHLVRSQASGNFFEEMGFFYIGPIDGHDLDTIIPVLENIRDDKTLEKPILLHVFTQKGKGFLGPEGKNESYHAVGKFSLDDFKSQPVEKQITYTKIFGEALVDLAKNDENIVAITAAMASGTGLEGFSKIYPQRFFDVGIAEQHAVTFAAGLACEGVKPYVAIYSTFLQRAYDQVVHDVAIQSLPVRFMIDRAGYVGADGATHAGSFDLTYLCTLPNMICMAPSDQEELKAMMKLSTNIDDKPLAIRYPRGRAEEALGKTEGINLGKGRVIKEGKDIAIISLGACLKTALEASEKLAKEGIEPSVVDARFAKPIDGELILRFANTHQCLITIEEGSIGGFSAQVNQLIHSEATKKPIIQNLFYPDVFIEADTQENQHKKAGIDASSLIKVATQMHLMLEKDKKTR